jgi:ABC-type cobalamin transport system ATPase subunit
MSAYPAILESIVESGLSFLVSEVDLETSIRKSRLVWAWKNGSFGLFMQANTKLHEYMKKNEWFP